MSKKALLVLGLASTMLSGGCDWLTWAHQIAIHTMSLASGISGINDLFNLGL